MSEVPGGSSEGKPNLTPILDMVFQLITFFMLVINFRSAALDMNLKLPVVGSARPVDSGGQTDLLILNIDKSGNLNVYGSSQDVERYVASEAKASVDTAKLTGRDFKEDDLPTTVVIRADREIPFGKLNRVIKACQDHGFRRFALKAMDKAA